MNGLSSLERIILESINKAPLTYNQIKSETGLRENICFNVIQALVIRGIVKTDGIYYRISDSLSPEIIHSINGHEAKSYEALELIEAVVEREQKQFKIQRVAMDEKDEKIFLALLSNLESFIKDAHKKSQTEIPLKSRKVIFWGIESMDKILEQLTTR